MRKIQNGMQYQTLTKKDFKKALEKLKPETDKDKSWSVYTDLDGMMQFDKALKKEVTSGQLKHLENSGFMDKKEAETLRLMMDASDADFTIAQLIIDNYESHI
jgi:ABC-type branched-subunit amino acid transport system substrate-binding protein